MPPIKTYAEPRFAVLYCGVLSLVIPLWVITTYAAQDDRRATVISLLIMGGFAFGIYWLWYYAAEFAAQERELGKLDAAQSAIDRTPDRQAHPRARPHGPGTVARRPACLERRARNVHPISDRGPGPARAHRDLHRARGHPEGHARRAAHHLRDRGPASTLLAPIAGLARAFGTSLSGVATSLILGLASTLTRRAELRLHQRIAGLCPGPQSPMHPVTRQTVALRVGAARSGRDRPASGSAGYAQRLPPGGLPPSTGPS